MAVQIGSGFNYSGAEPNFARDQYETIADMKAAKGAKFPKMHIASCLEDGRYYIYKRTNEDLETTGKWRPLASEIAEQTNEVNNDPNNAGNEPIQIGSKEPVILTQAEYDALYATKDDPDTAYDPKVIYLIKEGD